MWIAADEPTDADWTAAWGQVGGAIATSVAVIVTLWVVFRDRRWRRADQAERDTAQARLITVDLRESFGGIDDADSLQTTMRVVVTNDSAEPIVDAHVLELRSAQEPALAWDHEYSGDPYERDDAPILRPGETWEREVRYVIGDPTLKPWERLASVPAGAHSATVGFTDARGLRWTRTGTEAPTRRDPVTDTARRPKV